MLASEVPQDVQQELRALILKFESQADQARREYVRKCLKAYEFFRGNQYLWWDARIGEYRAPTQTGGLLAGASPTTAQNLYVTNIYQGFALSLAAILTANHPTQRFFPKTADRPEDRQAADAANQFIKIHEKTTKAHDRLLEEVFLLWTDGTVGSYVHTVADGDRFGWSEEDVVEEIPQPVGSDSLRCHVCGVSTPAEAAPALCPVCETPYGPEALHHAPIVMVPKIVGSKRIPKSKVVVDPCGGLELKLPPTAKNQWEFPYLIRVREVPTAIVRATYPELAKQITGKIEGGNQGNVDNTLELRARRQAAQGATIDNRAVLTNTGDEVTLKETWLRSWAFWSIDDETKRKQLLALFPDGCKITFADEVFCEVIPESMDDHWRICHALPGRGQVREPIGGTLIMLQEIVNDLTNIIRDVIEFTLPATFVDNEVLDVKKWARSNVLAGAVYSVRPKPNRSVSEAFYQTTPGQLPQYATQMLNEMRTTVPQFTVGAFPAAYGGGTPGNSTASGIALEKDAAMGRIGIFWRVLKEHHSEVATLIVREFARSGLEPEMMTDITEGGSYINMAVAPEDIGQGEIQAFAESTEDYPTTWPQRQGMLMQSMGNPLLQGDVAKLSNWDNIKRTLGIEIEHKGEKPYENQWRLIEQLIQARPEPVMQPAMQPVMGPGGPVIDPMSGQPQMQPVIDPATGQPQMQPAIGPDGQPQMKPSIPIGELDDHPPMFEACLDFDASERGQKARTENPEGYQNFLLHALARKQAMQTPMPMPPPGPQGGGQAPPQGPPQG